MEQHRDGEVKLTDNPTIDQFQNALDDMEYESISLHRPGTILPVGDTLYVVGKRGNWIKADDKTHAEQLRSECLTGDER